MLNYQGGFFASGYCGLSLLGFDFFLQSLSSPVSQKDMNSQDYYFFFLPALFCCHQNASALFFPSCFAPDSFLHSIASGPAQGSPRAQQNRGCDFSFNASSSARSSNCSKMNPALVTQLQAKAC